MSCPKFLLTLVHARHRAVGNPFHELLPHQPAPLQPSEQPDGEVILLHPDSLEDRRAHRLVPRLGSPDGQHHFGVRVGLHQFSVMEFAGLNFSQKIHLGDYPL